MQPQDALVLQDLEHDYDRVRAVAGVSLSVKAGEVVSIVAASTASILAARRLYRVVRRGRYPGRPNV